VFFPGASYVMSRAFYSNEVLVLTADRGELLFKMRNLSSHYPVVSCNNFRILLKIKKTDGIFLVRGSVLLPPARELHPSPWQQSFSVLHLHSSGPAKINTLRDSDCILVFNLGEVPGEVMEQYSGQCIKRLFCALLG